jgi:protein-S-isoprenylcysteine O-methyltransferase Ste14
MLAPPEPARTSPRPGLIWLVVIAAGWLIDLAIPMPFVPLRFAPVAAGGVVILTGFAIVALALHEMRDFNAPSEETGTAIPTLVTGGVYRLSRNPIYIGLAVALVGFAVALDSLWVLSALVPYVWIATRRVIEEEADLARIYGDLYGEYSKDVRRWL